MDSLEERLKNMTPLQRAVFALKETQARLDALEQKQAEPIAIVGMACRFPGGATDPASFWRLLCDGVDAIGQTPPDRWDADAFYDPDPAAPGKMATRAGGFLDRIDEFDNHFFSISDNEATRMDPQHRILLELAWEALEDAGVPPVTLRGAKIGVFVGISVSEYGMLAFGDLSQTGSHSAVGTSLCMAANRLSFVLGLQGPSMTLDTACSSSLVAIHLACQQIRSGECDGALVGGVNLLLSPFGSVNLTKAGFCAADGRVRAFDAAASGYVRSEGAGVVMLKPLSAALNNGDSIHALIRGSAVNQNGSSNGLTAPSRAAQEQLLREAYGRARVSPGDVQFVETQGTGTRLGDTIEAIALGNVLSEGRPMGSRCAIGALKTNIGHLEAASGMASLIKTALALKHRQVPPNLHFHTPNPDIPFDALPLQVPRKLTTWPESLHPRRAGVNAFGFGGSNAHVVLEEPPLPAESNAAGDRPDVCSTKMALSPSPGRRLLPLSARTDRALRDLADHYRRFLRDDSPAWPDVCHTAAARREHHDCRLAVLADSCEQAAGMLEHFSANPRAPASPHPSPLPEGEGTMFVGRKPFGRKLKVAFLFGNDLEGWKSHIHGLAETAPGFAAATAELDAICRRVAGWPLDTLWAEEARWSDPAWATSAAVILQLAMTAWWRHIGIVPDMVLGQGSGEWAAAVTAGILTTEDALHLAMRGRCSNGESRNGKHTGGPAALPYWSAADGKLHPGSDLDAAHWQSCVGRSDGLAAALAAMVDRRIDLGLEIGPASLAASIERLATHERPFNLVVPSVLAADGGSVDVWTAVGTLYAAGADPNWERLAAECGRCVRVPTYPWQRQRFWAPARYEAAQTAARPPADESIASPSSPEVRTRPDLTAPHTAPRTPLEAAMAQSWSAILGIEGIGVHDNFFELGGDSLQATILLNRLEQQLGEAVPGHVLFRIQTISDLADYLCEHCPDAVQRLNSDREAMAVLGDDLDTHGIVREGIGHRPAISDDGNGHARISIPRLARDEQAEDLLARLDELSEEEVNSLLETAMAEGEASNG